jgi:two-component system, cell cycle response regulator DivK
MSVQWSAEQFADIRNDVERMVERAHEHEADTEALAAAAISDVRHAESALSRTRDVPEDPRRALLEPYLHRYVAALDATRQLSFRAREQHDAARQLLTQLGGNTVTAPFAAQRKVRHAVLVVDDQEDRELVAGALRTAGFVVRTAKNGLEALMAVHEMRPAVIVMDVSIPVLDGVRATRLIKATQATRDAKVIAYTGKVPFDRSAETLFAAVLQKPATHDTVLATVQQCAGL